MTVMMLDGQKLLSINDVHRVVRQTFDLNHYGENLDALWDVLTTQKNVHIIIKNDPLLQHHLGQDYMSLMRLFEDLKTQPPLQFSIDIKN